MRIETVVSEEMLGQICDWVQEVVDAMPVEEVGWDDVNNIPLEIEDVKAGRKEEAGYMLGRVGERLKSARG